MRPFTAPLSAALAGLALLPATAASAEPIPPQRIVVRAPALTDPLPAQNPLAEEDRLVQLGLPRPERFGPETPERAVAEFLTAWHDRAWDRMAMWSTADAPALRRALAVDRIRGWAITGAEHGDLVGTVDVVTARRGMRPVLRRERSTLIVAQGADGRWRVRPPRLASR